MDLADALQRARRDGLCAITVWSIASNEAMVSAQFDRGGSKGWAILHCPPDDIPATLLKVLVGDRVGVDPGVDYSTDWLEDE